LPALPLNIGTVASRATINSLQLPLSLGAGVGAKVEVVASVGAVTSTVSTVVDSQGNTYTQGASQAVNSSIEMWFSDLAVALNNTDTITVTWNGAATLANWQVSATKVLFMAVGAPAVTDTHGQTSNVPGWTGSAGSGVTTTDAGALVRGAAQGSRSTVTAETSPLAGFTELVDFNTGGTRPQVGVYQFPGVTGTFNPGGTWDVSSTYGALAWAWYPSVSTPPVAQFLEEANTLQSGLMSLQAVNRASNY
jgi:hypothetical protein